LTEASEITCCDTEAPQQGNGSEEDISRIDGCRSFRGVYFKPLRMTSHNKSAAMYPFQCLNCRSGGH